MTQEEKTAPDAEATRVVMVVPPEFDYMAREFGKLVAALRQCNRAFDAAEISDDLTPLTSGMLALRAVMNFLDADAMAKGEKLSRPLAFIENLVFDVRRGATPRAIREGSREKKPNYTMREFTQGSMAVAVELVRIFNPDQKLDDVIAWVASVGRKEHALREDGTDISKKQLEGWRHDIGKGDASIGARKIYADLLTHFRPMIASRPKEGQADDSRAAATFIIQTVALKAPRSAPKPNAPPDPSKTKSKQ